MNETATAIKATMKLSDLNGIADLKPRYIIGLDPGKHTGFAVWDVQDQKLIEVESRLIHDAMNDVLDLFRGRQLIRVVFEDARLRTWFGRSDAKQAKYGAAVREGAGAAKRDATIWQDFLEAHGIPFTARKPAAGATKWTVDYFKKVTGWTARTSEHGRDAACLLIGAKR